MSAGVLGEVERLVEALKGVEPALLSGADCAVLAERLAVAEKACAGLRARVAARAAACGAHRGLGYAEPAAWLARVAGSSVGEARAALETAASLPEVPEVGDALAEGSLSLAQAAEIARTEDVRPGSASLLLDVARRRGLGALREEGRRMRLAAVDPEELHRRQRAARSFRHWRDGEGMVCFRGALAPADGVAFVNRLDAEADRIRRAAKREGSTEPFEAHAADALVKLTEGRGRGRSRSADVVVVCDINAFRRGKAEEGEPCHIVGGGPIPVSVAEELSSDAFLKAVCWAATGRRPSATARPGCWVGAGADGGLDMRWHGVLECGTVRWARLALAVALLGGCSGGRDDDTLPPPVPRSSTTTLDDAVPETIDVAYVERVMAALDHVYGDAIRTLATERTITEDFLNRLRAIYGDRFFSLAQDAWVKDVASGLPTLAPSPGDPKTTVQQVLQADRQCIVASVARDFGPIRTTPPPGTPQRFIGLIPLDASRNTAEFNPTPWMLAYDGYTDEGQPPPDPCVAS